MMIKSSLLLSALLAAGVTACHHEPQTATPASAEAASAGGSAASEPGVVPTTDNSYDRDPSYGGAAVSNGPTRTIVGRANPGADPSDTPATPGRAAGSGNDTDVGKNGNDVNKAYNTPPDTSAPTMGKDGNGSNARKRSSTTSGSSGATRSGTQSGSDTGPDSGSNGSGSADRSSRDSGSDR